MMDRVNDNGMSMQFQVSREEQDPNDASGIQKITVYYPFVYTVKGLLSDPVGKTERVTLTVYPEGSGKDTPYSYEEVYNYWVAHPSVLKTMYKNFLWEYIGLDVEA